MTSESSAGPGPPPPRPPDPGEAASSAARVTSTESQETSMPQQDAKNTGTDVTQVQDDKHGEPTRTTHAGNAGEATPTPRLEGWNPEVTNRIKQTMARTWSPPLAHVLSGDTKRLFAIATAVYPLHDDEHLRAMTTDEEQAFAAYMKGDLDLPAPPTFLTCTATTLKRAGMLAYHQRHIEVTLIANVGSELQVGKYLKKKSILRELHEANGGTEQGSMLMKRLMTDALRITFDGLYTMSFVFPSRRVAKPWEGAALKFRTGAIVLASARSVQQGVKPPPQVAQHYAVNVLGVSKLDPFKVMTVFNSITGNHVIDIRQRGLDGLNEPDNDYWTVIFSDLECPAVLRGVTCIIVQDENLFIHHFKRLPSPPCMRCYNQNHHHSRCKVLPNKLSSVRATRQRKYTGSLPEPIHFDPSDYADTDFLNGVLEPLHVVGQSTSGNNSDILLVAVQVQTERGIAVPAADLQPAPAAGCAERAEDDGFRLQRRQKVRKQGTGVLSPVTTPHSSTRANSRHEPTSPSIDTAPHPVPEGNAPSGDSTEAGLLHTKPKAPSRSKPKKKVKFKTFAQLAASERYRQTRAVYDLLNAEADDESAEDMDTETTEHSNLQSGTAESSLSVQESIAEAMDVDGAGRNAEPGRDESKDIDTSEEPSGLTMPSREVLIDGEADRTHFSEHSDTQAASDEEAGTTSTLSFHDVLSDWMKAHGGHHVAVNDNGQSLYLAYYAATTNPAEDRLRLSAEDTSALNVIKRNVLNLLLTRIRYDIQLDLFQPLQELSRMYPATPAPAATAAATSKLYAHFAADRDVCVSSHTPDRARALRQELRALALYSREPIYVWTFGETGATRVDQYTIHTYTMPNGDLH